MSTGFIFDVDGTILDSMGIWMNVGELYLKDMGIKAKSNLGEILFEMTMNEGAEYIQKKYNLNLTTEEICTGINNRVYKFYEKEAMPKPKVIDFIEQAYENKILWHSIDIKSCIKPPVSIRWTNRGTKPMLMKILVN